MLGRQIKHPSSTKSDLDSDSVRSVKRLKRVESGESLCSGAALSEDGDGPRNDTIEPGDDDVLELGQTSLETTLPLVRTDKEAIEAYETAQAADVQRRSGESKWVKGKTSIYVDAFNLALETVLKDEGHLFNEPELAVFKNWEQLNYEAQYLYVWLSLRSRGRGAIPFHWISPLGKPGP